MKTLARSFAGGEITPEMFGRIDLNKYQTGLQRCDNFVVLPHGPIARRPGFRYVNEVKDSTRPVNLIDFQFSSTQSMVLELGHLYMRFHTNGQTLLEANKTIVSTAGSTVTVTAHGYSVGQWVFIGGRFYIVAAVPNANSFGVTGLDGAPAAPTGVVAARVYEIATPWPGDDVMEVHYAQNSDVVTLVHPGHAARELKRLGATNWTLTPIDFAPSAVVPTGVAVTPTVAVAGNQSPCRYVVTAIGADRLTESLRSLVVGTNNNLSVAGNFNTITWSAVAGATRYNVYKQRGGSFGYIGTTTLLSVVDDNVTPDTLKTPPEDIYTLNTTAGTYPWAVTYYEQRRFFAGTVNAPQTVWATRNGTPANLTSSLPSQDDDGLQFSIASRQQNTIRHLMPLADLLALTVGAEFRIYADNAPAITPTSLSIKPQGYTGAAPTQPALTSGSVLYVQAQGSRIREMAYNWQSSAYASIDVSIMAPHLFDGFSIARLAYARAPVPALWCVRNDGKLLCMTYVPEQQVYAWSQQTTAGAFKSICAVSEASEDVLYAVVERVIGARTVQMIERLDTRIAVPQEGSFFVDSGLTYSGTPVSAVSGLWHLEGRTVQVLTDGAVHPQKVVTAGAIPLDYPASVVHVGLGYSSDAVTLPLTIEAAAGGQGVTKNVNKVAIRVTRSSLVKAGPTFGKLVEFPARDATDPYDSPPNLRTAELRFALTPSWNTDGVVCLRQDQPVPLTVLSVAVDFATGG